MLRKKDYLSYKALIESEKEKILNNPEELERIYEKLDERFELKDTNENHA
ncbi:FbpB family small basic protein [Bacillaceae bacterium W0354]